MGVLGWIALGMAAALLANMALRQKITDASFQRPDLPRRSSGPAAGLPPAHQAIRPAGREHASPGHPRRITMKSSLSSSSRCSCWGWPCRRES